MIWFITKIIVFVVTLLVLMSFGLIFGDALRNILFTTKESIDP